MSRFISILISLFFLSGSAHAGFVSTSVESIGYGSNYQIAEQQALTKALQMVCGVQLNASELSAIQSRSLSRKTGDGSKLSKSENAAFYARQVQSKTKGFVEKYREISRKKQDNGTCEIALAVVVCKYEQANQPTRKALTVKSPIVQNVHWHNQQPSKEEVSVLLKKELQRAFVGTRKFQVLDRENSTFAEERAFLNSDEVDLRELAKVGAVRCADFIASATIRNLEGKAKKIHLDLSGDTLIRKSAEVTIDFNIVDFVSHQIVFSKTLRTMLSNNELRNQSNDSSLTAILQKASDELVRATCEQIYPPMIVHTNGKEVTLNYGGDAIKVGDTFRVYRLGSELKDISTAETLGAAEDYIGKIRVTDVSPKTSQAVFIEGRLSDRNSAYFCRYAGKTVKPKKKSADPLEDD